MKIPSHTFSPGNIGLPYAKEIDKHMKPPGLLIREHDVDLGPDSTERFHEYIRKQPRRIHAAPYLVIQDTALGKRMVWVNRNLQTRNASDLPRKTTQKLRQYLPGNPKPMQIILSVTVFVQGGEAETSLFGLGYTWMPYHIWDRIRVKVIEVDWQMLDTRISQACLLLEEKAVCHWDTIGSHSHVLD